MKFAAPVSRSVFATLTLVLGGALGALAQSPAVPTAPAAASAAVRTLVLVRHGHYAPDPKADPTLGPGLSPLGVAQARLVGARLAGLPFDFDAVLASPLTRAAETARVIAAELPNARIETVADLAECTPPTWRTEVTANEPVEQQKSCAAQLDRLFAQRFVPVPATGGGERRELLVAHGNVIRYLVTKALRVDSQSWLEMSPGHASVTVIRVEVDGRFKVIALGDVGHLPFNLQTGSTGNPERDLLPPAAPAAPPVTGTN